MPGTLAPGLGQVPEQLYEPADVYYRAYTSDAGQFADRLRAFSVRRSAHARLQSYVADIFRQSASEGSIRLTTLDDVFCDSESCLIGTPESSYYYDADHLSVTGAMKTVDAIRALVGMESFATANQPASF